MGGSRDCRPLWLAPLDHTLLPGTSLYVIAQDLRTVLDITQDDAVRFQKWMRLQQEEVRVGLLVRECEVAADQQQHPDQQRSGSWLHGPSSLRGLRQPLLQQQLNNSGAAVAGNTQAPAGMLQASSVPTCSTEKAHCADAGGAAATVGLQNAAMQHTPSSAAGLDMTRHASSTVFDISQLQPLQQQQPGSLGSSSAATATHGSNRLPAAAAAAAAAVPDVLGLQCGDGTAAHESSDSHRHHHHGDRQAVQLNTHARAAPTHSHGELAPTLAEQISSADALQTLLAIIEYTRR
jgi:hypothetical protein